MTLSRGGFSGRRACVRGPPKGSGFRGRWGSLTGREGRAEARAISRSTR